MKKFVTTKGYIIFIALSVIYLIVKYNQALGIEIDYSQYETEWSKVIYDLYNPLHPFYDVYWFTIFPLFYFIMQKKQYRFSFVFILLHIATIIALIKIPYPFDMKLFAHALVLSWVLFFINIIAAFMMGKRKGE